MVYISVAWGLATGGERLITRELHKGAKDHSTTSTGNTTIGATGSAKPVGTSTDQWTTVGAKLGLDQWTTVGAKLDKTGTDQWYTVGTRPNKWCPASAKQAHMLVRRGYRELYHEGEQQGE